jgi:hypothetical protein
MDARRNIAVVMNASPAELDLDLDLGYPQAPMPQEVTVAFMLELPCRVNSDAYKILAIFDSNRG